MTTVYEEMGDARLRELVILAVAGVSDCSYVWQAHVTLARESGIADAKILAIADSDYPEFSGAEHAAVSSAVAHVTNSVTDETHALVAEHFNDSDIVTISTLASEYARVIAAAGAPAEFCDLSANTATSSRIVIWRRVIQCIRIQI